ncbi:MAG: hypothetical protein L0220_19705 [Acidobacteria bacterium]|nr:hypothetical protein [Acidobacteriota bacterium]
MKKGEKTIGAVLLLIPLLSWGLLSVFSLMPQRTNKASEPHVSPTALVFTSPTSAWRYFGATDPVSGIKEWGASTDSLNILNFDRPYQGDQRATLTLRKHPRFGNNVILQIERGQFLVGTTGVQVAVRFDQGPLKNFWADGRVDHSTTTLFIGSYAKFVEALRKSKLVRIAAPIYQEGSPVLEFNVAGFEPDGGTN